MTKFNLEKCKSGNKGITLIALIITIIVLLILAGITIASLTGSDSAPAKANEAKQRNDIGSAKDQLAVVVQNAHLEAYDDIYVKNNSTVSSTAANTTVGQRVINAALEKYGASENMKFGDASIVVAQTAGQDATVTITTRDYKQKGKISVDGGVLTWQTLAENNGDDTPENAVVNKAKAGDIKVGDYVNYTPSEGSVTVTSAQTGADAAQTFSTANNTGMTWRVLSVDSTTGEVKIVGSPTTQQLTLYGKAGFGNAETVLNSIAGIFGGGTGAASVRSITEDDIFDAIGYDKGANYVGTANTYTSGEWFTETWDSTSGTATYSTTTTIATDENPVTLHNTAHNHYNANNEWVEGGINVASQTLENGTAAQKATMQIYWDMLIGGEYEDVKEYETTGCFNYWFSSRFVISESNHAEFCVRSISDSMINGEIFAGYEGYSNLYGYLIDNGGELMDQAMRSVVPIVTLQSNIEIEQDTSANKTTWNFV